LKEAAASTSEGVVCVIVMEEGLAHLFLVGRNTSKLKARIEKRVSKKKAFVN
jgi:stalled ribosome rescue protein Dom34